MVNALPADSATARALHGETVRWTLTDHLLAVVADRLAVISWQLQADPKKPYPQPMPRPGVEDQTVRHGSRPARPTAEVVAYLRRWAPKREEVTAGG